MCSLILIALFLFCVQQFSGLWNTEIAWIAWTMQPGPYNSVLVFISKFYAKYHHKHTRKWQCIWYLCVRWAEKVIVLMLVYIVHAQVKPKNGFHSASKYIKLHSRKIIRNNNNNSGRSSSSSSKCSQNKIKIIKKPKWSCQKATDLEGSSQVLVV